MDFSSQTWNHRPLAPKGGSVSVAPSRSGQNGSEPSYTVPSQKRSSAPKLSGRRKQTSDQRESQNVPASLTVDGNTPVPSPGGTTAPGKPQEAHLMLPSSFSGDHSFAAVNQSQVLATQAGMHPETQYSHPLGQPFPPGAYYSREHLLDYRATSLERRLLDLERNFQSLTGRMSELEEHTKQRLKALDRLLERQSKRKRLDS